MDTTIVRELSEAELDEVQGGQGTQVCATTLEGTCICSGG
jgi:hypothetical protein